VRGAPRVHAHLLESARQRQTGQGDPVDRLDRAGLLGARSSFAHGVWLESGQIERLAGSASVVVHCPGSNTRLGVGRCPVRRLLDAGVTVALGLDSHGAGDEPDMFAEMRLALRTAAERGAPLSAAEVLAMATVGGARALCRDDLGALNLGASADVVALDLPGAARVRDPIEYVVREATPADVAARWIGGKRIEPGAPTAAMARRRCEAAIAQDTEARAARIGVARAAYERVERVWSEREVSERAITGSV
jgi:5-methylthioadenosine/S-adenosylhomocysteine deaminase